jgi:hypothetical protein
MLHPATELVGFDRGISAPSLSERLWENIRICTAIAGLIVGTIVAPLSGSVDGSWVARILQPALLVRLLNTHSDEGHAL